LIDLCAESDVASGHGDGAQGIEGLDPLGDGAHLQLLCEAGDGLPPALHLLQVLLQLVAVTRHSEVFGPQEHVGAPARGLCVI